MTDTEKKIIAELERLFADTTERLIEARASDAHWDACNHIDTARAAYENALDRVRRIVGSDS